MHELSIAQSLAKIIVKECEKNNIKRVKKVNISVGVLKNVVEDSLEAAFEMVSKNTCFEEAKLVIKSAPIKVSCNNCGNSFGFEKPADFEHLCKKCKSSDIEIKSGMELNINSIEGE